MFRVQRDEEQPAKVIEKCPAIYEEGKRSGMSGSQGLYLLAMTRSRV